LLLKIFFILSKLSPHPPPQQTFISYDTGSLVKVKEGNKSSIFQILSLLNSFFNQ
jgi:hypothetical protein